AGAGVTWTVHMANSKSAWYDFDLALDIPEAATTQSARRNRSIGNRAKLVIDPGERSIAGRNTYGPQYELAGGTFLGKSVSLGQLRTDDGGRLLVFGGVGQSASIDNCPASTFANNDGWHDDVGDGPVTATVTIGGKELEVEHAWVVVAPPDYAPGLIAVVTFYDILRDVAWQSDPSILPAKPSFNRDIAPLFERLAMNQWANGGFGKLFHELPALMTRLGDNSSAAKDLRTDWFSRFRNPDYVKEEPDAIPPVYGDNMDLPPQSPRQWMAVTKLQYAMLKLWAAGDFLADYDPKPGPQHLEEYPLPEQPGIVDAAALDNTIGGPFHPGCEMTWPMRHAILYEKGKPFRIKRRIGPEPDYGAFLDTTKALAAGGPLDGSGPGSISRWMAVPWQTDTSSCLYAYEGTDPFLPTFWPVRVPNTVLTEEQYATVLNPKATPSERAAAFAYENRPFWLRALPPRAAYKKVINAFVTEWNEVGIVTQRPGPKDGTFPSPMHVELGMNVVPSKPMLKAATAKVAATAPEVDGDRQPDHLPNPRDFR
ncbi:MAG: hypothetical protein QOH21_1711, partial [Acidobacteriota bacterium]|nr:hypothetical protein [Acidobacteriota bacterium]